MSLRNAFKWVLRSVALLFATPFLVGYWLQACAIGRDRALLNATQALALWPGLSGQYVRRAFLARVLAECHRSATIEFGSLFSKVGARLGENVYVGPRCHIGLAHLERDALIAAGVHIPSGARTHAFDDTSAAIRDQGGETLAVRIGAGAWVGSAAVVMADVGAGAVVGAGSVVTKPLPPRVVAAGVPAKVIRHIDGGDGVA